MKSVLNIHWKDWCWRWNSNTLATWWEELTPWKRPWCWERLKAGGEGWWHHWFDGHEFEWTPGVGNGTGRPGMLQSMGQKESDMTEWLNWTEAFSVHLCAPPIYTHYRATVTRVTMFPPPSQACFLSFMSPVVPNLMLYSVSQDTGKEEFVHFRSLGSWEQWPLGCLVKHMRSSLHFLLGSQDGFWK